MADNFEIDEAQLDSPLENFFSVTANDSTDLAQSTRSVLIENDGTLVVTGVGDTDDTSVALPLKAGWHPIRVKRIWATGTADVGTIIGAY